MTTIRLETEFIDGLIARFRPSPLRRTKPHEADAELIDLPAAMRPGEGTSHPGLPLLAVTTDTVSEEISSGLYADLCQAGWIAAVASLSDLAAVGAEPLGILVSETLPPGLSRDDLDDLQKGIAEACASAGTHVLGGDTNSGGALSITGTAIGLVPGGMALTRRGCAPGDALFVSGPPGRGNGYALTVFGDGPASAFPGGYLPRARVREGILLRGTASACMDSSDGIFSTLETLGALNGVGFSILESWEESLDGAALAAVRERGLPPWLLLAGCHGEFELVFTIGASRREGFLGQAAAAGWRPVELGAVTGEPGILLPVDGGIRRIDATRISNLSFRMTGDVGRYIEALLQEELFTEGA